MNNAIKDVTGFDLSFENTYEWYKTFLLDLAKKRIPHEKKLVKYAQKIKDGVRVDRNRWRLIEVYGTIEEISILWYKILEEAIKDFPDIVADPDMPNGTRDMIDVFALEREESAKKLEEGFKASIEDLLRNAR